MMANISGRPMFLVTKFIKNNLMKFVNKPVSKNVICNACRFGSSDAVKCLHLRTI